jgi:hypothetical protein
MNAYNQVPYVNRPYSKTHPDHMAVLAQLHGVNAPPVERARVLDIGASEGGNLIPMALTLPEAQFTGIDLAGDPVERGRRVIRDLGLDNIRLLQMDLMNIDESFGEFDYIIAHGLYAWTPEPIRDKLLGVARANLSPNGVAFVSYNAMPGGHLRRYLREMMLFHIGDAQDPALRLERAREMLRLLAAARPNPTTLHDAMTQEAQDLLKQADSALFHDFLADVYEPCSLADFVQHAERHGLTYLADASVLDTYNVRLAPETMEEVARMAGGDRVRREQYYDLLRVRGFRQSLICRREANPDAEWNARRAVGLYISTSAEPAGPMQFTTAGGAVMSTANAAVAEYVRRLSELFPARKQIDETDAELALELFRRGIAELHTDPGVAVRAGEKPLASPLARYQALRGEPLFATLDHRALSGDDQAARDFLLLLDGTRDRAALARESGLSLEQVEDRLFRMGRFAMLLA